MKPTNQKLVLLISIIHAVMAGAIFVYGLIGFSIAESKEEFSIIFYYVLAGIALISFVVAWGIKRFFIDIPTERGQLDLSNNEHHARYISAHIISFALVESIGTFSLIIRFLGGTQSIHIGFILASFLVLLFLKPRKIETS